MHSAQMHWCCCVSAQHMRSSATQVGALPRSRVIQCGVPQQRMLLYRQDCQGLRMRDSWSTGVAQLAPSAVSCLPRRLRWRLLTARGQGPQAPHGQRAHKVAHALRHRAPVQQVAKWKLLCSSASCWPRWHIEWSSRNLPAILMELQSFKKSYQCPLKACARTACACRAAARTRGPVCRGAAAAPAACRPARTARPPQSRPPRHRLAWR